MKQVIRILLMSIFTFGLLACGDSDKRESIRGNGGGDRGVVGDSDENADFQSATKWPGIIFFLNSQYQSDFENAVKKLASSFMDPNKIGFVSADPQADTGVVFRGQLHVNGGFDPNASTSYSISSAGMDVMIWDSIARDNPDVSGIVIGGLKLENYTFGSNKSLNLRFSYTVPSGDGGRTLGGYIEFSGDYRDGIYAGAVGFRNVRRFDGQSVNESWMTSLGDFQIPVCALLNCQ